MSKISQLPVADHIDGAEYLPVVQAGATKRATLAAFRDMIVPFLQFWYKGDKGDPGADASNVGRFDQVATLDIPEGTEAIRTSGYSQRGVGAANYVYDPAIDADYVAANPYTATISKNGRGFRLSEPFVMAAMVGALAGVQTDQAPRINAALALLSTKWVMLEDGTTWTGQTAIVPEGKALWGGAKSEIRALSTWQIGRDNSGVLLEGHRASAHSLTIDMNKVGLGEGSAARVNGIKVLDGARDCRKTDLKIMNCTGYGNYDAGEDNRANPPQSYSRNVRTFNCQVHHEAQGAVGSVYFDCHALDGDGDIPSASYFHPDVGSRYIRYIGCTAYGKSSCGFDLLGNIAKLADIYIIDCDIEMTSDTVAIAAPPGWIGIESLYVTGGRFKTPYIAVSLQDTNATFTGARFEAPYPIEVTNSNLDCHGCTALGGTDPAGAAVGRGIIARGTGRVRWNGGVIKITGPAPDTAVAEGNVVISSDTEQTPAPVRPPAIKARSRGQATFDGDGETACFTAIFPTYGDIAKCHLSLSVRGRIDGYIPAHTIGWNEIEPGFIRVRVTGANLATVTGGVPDHHLDWELTEIA